MPVFGEPECVSMRPRDALIGNPDYIAWDLDGHTAFVRRRALGALFELSRRFGREPPRREVAFQCMGRRDVDAIGSYTIIDALPLVALGEPDQVVVTSEARWCARRRFAGWDEVGYAHTHPGFGIFFSAADRTTASDYGALGVHLLHDPVREELGVALGEQILCIFSTGAPRKRRDRMRSARPQSRSWMRRPLIVALFVVAVHACAPNDSPGEPQAESAGELMICAEP